MTLPIERVDKSRFIAVDDLKPMDLSKRLHVIACGVGLGKSTLVLDAKHGFTDYLRANVDGNLTADDVVFLTPRRILKDNPGVFASQFRVETVQGYIKRLAGGREELPRVAIIDEVHLLFAECEFCDEMGTLLDEVEHGHRETVWVGLTATPNVLDWLGRGLSFEYVTDRVMVKYGIERITIAHGNTLMRFVEEVVFRDALPSGDNRVWIYVSNKKDGVELRDWLIGQGARAVFVCSKSNDKDKKCDERAYGWLADPRTEGFPPGIDAIVTTSVTEVGITVREQSLKTVVVDSIYPDAIVQVCGRFRGDIEHLCVLNRYAVKDIQRKLDRFERFAGVVEAISNNLIPQEKEGSISMLLGECFDCAKEGKTASNAVVRSLDGIHYSVNHRLRDLFSYRMMCARSACSYGEDSQAVEYYRKMFDSYCGEQGIEFVDIRPKALDGVSDAVRIAGVDLGGYLGRKLYRGQTNDVRKAIGIRNKNGELKRLQTLEASFLANGLSLKSGRDRRGRYVLIEQCPLPLYDNSPIGDDHNLATHDGNGRG